MANERQGHPQWTARWATLLAVAAMLPVAARGADIETDPINYSDSTPANAVSQLQQRLASGQVRLEWDDRVGYLRTLLKALHVPESSQTLVFSKTSLQRHRIMPRKPRALYFNDQVYVGFCQGGDLLEVSAVDPQLGTVYYTLDQEPTDTPKLVRQTDNCLICHGSSHSDGFPGHVLRSVFADGSGQPILSSGSYRIDQTSPLKHRWGGWYVTGTHGRQTHLGNLVVRNKSQRPEDIDNAAGQNVTDLSDRLDTARYLTPHSDIVALMVLEHQTGMHNLITRANMLTRQALWYEASLDKAFDEPTTELRDSTLRRITDAGEPLVKYLLFSGEAELTDRLQGTSSFAEEFARQGPRDRRGRSLRDLDLERRLFRYPCSYLIYSEAFDALPTAVRDYVYRRLWDVLTGHDTSQEFAHLSTEDRQAILEILRDTKPNLPASWKTPPPGDTTTADGK